MERLLLIGLLLYSPLTGAMDLYGGLTEYFTYESSLPCESKKSSCNATNGVLGYALDQANQAGLDISNVRETNSNDEVYIVSKTYGLCKVETKDLQNLGTLGFLCSSTKQSNKVDRVLSLTKDENKYALLDLTNNRQIKGDL